MQRWWFLGLSFSLRQFRIPLIPLSSLAIVHLTMRFSQKKQGTSMTQWFLHSTSRDCYGSSCNISYSLFATQVQEENNVVWPCRERICTFSFFLPAFLLSSFQEAISRCFSLFSMSLLFFSHPFKNLSCASDWQPDLYFRLSIKYHQPLELSTDSNHIYLYIYSFYTASSVIILFLPADVIHYDFILKLSLNASQTWRFNHNGMIIYRLARGWRLYI